MELPEGCIAAILSHKTPVDVCKLSLVSKTFRFAAESDTIWNHFIPFDSHFISQFSLLANAPTKKALYLALSHRPIIIDNGTKSIQVDRKSGKKCYMLGAKALVIDSHENQQFWDWNALPESRFSEVANLSHLYSFKFHTKIKTLSLSPNTQYAAYLVFKMVHRYDFQNHPFMVMCKLSAGVKGGHINTKHVCLERNDDYMSYSYRRTIGLTRSSLRGDGWWEIEMGEFYISDLEDEEIQLRVAGISSYFAFKIDFFLEGIEVRPK